MFGQGLQQLMAATALSLAAVGMIASPAAFAGSQASGAPVIGMLHGSGGATGGFAESVGSNGNRLRGGLTVWARGLRAKSSYTVLSGGTSIGKLATDRRGNGQVLFVAGRAGRGGRVRPLTTDPRGKRLAVSEDGTNEEMSGEVGDPTAPGAIPCCLNSADEQGCSDLLPGECAAAGGAVSTATSCDPDPCQAGQVGEPDDGESADDDGQDGETNDDEPATARH